jgi:hypothetical protein
MAQDLLGIPATSTPSERMFSQAGEIFTSCRKCLNPDSAQALLNVGSWWGVGGLPGHDAPILPESEKDRKINLCLPLVVEVEGGGWRIENDEGPGEMSFEPALKAVGAEVEEM